MTLSDMRNDVKYSCGLENDSIPDSQINDWINRGLENIGRRTLWPFLFTEDTLTTTSGTETYSLATDIAFIYMVRDTTNNKQYKFVTNREFFSGTPNPTATGVPYWYRFSGESRNSTSDDPAGQISFYPIPGGTYALKISSYLRMPTLSQDGDLPLLPIEFHDLPVHYACMRYFSREGDGRAKSHYDLFENGIKDMQSLLVSQPVDKMDVLKSIDDYNAPGIVQFPPTFQQPRW